MTMFRFWNDRIKPESSKLRVFQLVLIGIPALALGLAAFPLTGHGWNGSLEGAVLFSLPRNGEQVTGPHHVRNADPAAGKDVPGSTDRAELSRIKNLVRKLGIWDSWFDKLDSLHEAILKRTNPETEILVGTDGWLYQGLLAEFLLIPPSGERQRAWGEEHRRRHPGSWVPTLESAEKAVIQLDHRLRSRGIDLLFLPIPEKAEVYPEYISKDLPKNVPVSPQRYRVLGDLLSTGVHTLDLLPAFEKLKETDDDFLYSKTDIHWKDRTVRATAKIVAEYIRDNFALPEDPSAVRYTMETRRFQIKPSLAKAAGFDLGNDGKEHDDAEVVIEPNGSPYDYRAHQESPILVIGDSFMMGGRKGASFAAHLAYELNRPVSGSYHRNGGQQAPRALARNGGALLKNRRVLVWYVVSGMLGRYWPLVDLPGTTPQSQRTEAKK